MLQQCIHTLKSDYKIESAYKVELRNSHRLLQDNAGEDKGEEEKYVVCIINEEVRKKVENKIKKNKNK